MKKLFRVDAFNYALLGGVFGICFPIMGTFIEARNLYEANDPEVNKAVDLNLLTEKNLNLAFHGYPAIYSDFNTEIPD